MNVVKCPDCDKEVSKSAEKCPHCGREFQMNKFTKLSLGSPLFLFILLIFVLFGFWVLLRYVH